MDEDGENIIQTTGKNHFPQNEIKIKVGISGSKFLFLELCDIVYFRAGGRGTNLVHVSFTGELKVSRSIGEWADFLQSYSFIRAGRSYLVNIKYVHEVDIVKRTCILQLPDKSITLDDLSDSAIKALIKNDYFVI